jgi:hypothetical protein
MPKKIHQYQLTNIRPGKWIPYQSSKSTGAGSLENNYEKHIIEVLVFLCNIWIRKKELVREKMDVFPNSKDVDNYDDFARKLAERNIPMTLKVILSAEKIDWDEFCKECIKLYPNKIKPLF